MRVVKTCTAYIGKWNNGNMYKSKQSITYFIVFSSKQQIMKTENLNIRICFRYTVFCVHKKTFLHSTLGMGKAVKLLCKSNKKPKNMKTLVQFDLSTSLTDHQTGD